MSRGARNSLRRKLKMILKEADRIGVEGRDVYVRDQLRTFGLAGHHLALVCALKMRKCKSRTFKRLGKAAIRQGKLAPIYFIADCAERGIDLRTITFWHTIDFTIERAIREIRAQYE